MGMSGISIWQLLIVFAIVVSLLSISWTVAKKAGYSGWWGLTILIPVVSVVIIWVFAFAKWPGIFQGSLQRFLRSGTWTKPAYLKYVRVTVVGGGGGGGGGAMATIAASALGNTETVTVGVGGIGGSVSDTLETSRSQRLKYVQSDGSAGGASAFGTHCTASGGRGGPTCVYVPENNQAQAIAVCGAGGVGSEGGTCTALLFYGRRGEQGLTTIYRNHKRIYDGLCYTGSGGDNFLGGGGGSIAPTTTASFVSTDGHAGTANTGGGGGGSLTVATDSDASKKTGGNGGSGLVIVEAFF